MFTKIFYCIYILLLSSSLIACNDRDKILISQGNTLVNKVELYRQKNGELPTSLSDIGIIEKAEGPLYYQKKDSTRYIIWFGNSLGESKTYYSDSKKWEDQQR